MTHLLITLVFASLGGSALLSFGLLALRSGIWTAAILLALWIATVAVRDSVDLSATFAGVRVTALDVISAVLIIVALSRLLSAGIGTFGSGLSIALLLLLAIHIGRGAAEFSVQSAVNPARGWLYFTAALVYGATFPGGWDHRIWKLFAAAGIVLAAISIPYLLVEGVHPATSMVYRNGAWITSRPVAAAGALLMLQAAIVLPVIRWPSAKASVYLAVAMGAVVVAVEHRTVWVAGLVVSVVGLSWWSNRRIRAGDTSVLGPIGAVLLLFPIAVWGLTRTGPLLTSIKETTTSNSTFSWRTTSWQELIGSHHSVSQPIGGGASGTSWSRVVQGQVVDVSPHDGFVDSYLRFGLPGVAVICALGFILWRRRSSVGSSTGISAEAVGLLVLTQLVFSVAYTLDTVQGLVDGILVSGLAATSLMRAPAVARGSQTALTLEHAAR